jgi:hypothetical protein
VRTLLALLLIHGMAPALGEVVESAVHFAMAGHLAHSDADHGDLGNQGDEHGCGTTEHRCHCCASQVVAPPASSDVAHWAPSARRAFAPTASLTTADDTAPPHRPPIAS